MKKNIIRNLFSDDNFLKKSGHNNAQQTINDEIILDKSKALKAFFSAINREDVKKVKSLLKSSNVDINSQNKQGMSGLHISLLKKNYEMMELLISNDIDINIKTPDGDTPLNYALGLCDTKFAKRLIDSGADINDISFYGELPLHTATRNGHWQAVEMLLNRNADMEALSRKGYKPLGISILNMHLSTSMALISYGAEISSENLEDVVTPSTNLQEFLLSALVTTAAMLDHIPSTQTNDLKDYNTRVRSLYNQLDAPCKIVLNSRMINQFYWKKNFSTSELKEATDRLIDKMLYLDDKIGMDLSSWVYILSTNYEFISSGFLSSEEGGVPSLFRLTLNSMKKKGIWDQKFIELNHPDTADKARILDNAYEFLNRYHITLQSKLESNIESNMNLTTVNYHDSMELVGEEERYDFMNTDWVLE